MSVTVDWMDASYSVIHANFMDNWGWSEWSNALNDAHKLMAKCQRPITIMLDFLGSHKVANTDTLHSIPKGNLAPDNLVRIVVISADQKLGRKMVKILHDIYPQLDDVVLTQTHQAAFENVRSTVEMPAVT